jgi:hypothetical protein
MITTIFNQEHHLLYSFPIIKKKIPIHRPLGRAVILLHTQYSSLLKFSWKYLDLYYTQICTFAYICQLPHPVVKLQIEVNIPPSLHPSYSIPFGLVFRLSIPLNQLTLPHTTLPVFIYQVIILFRLSGNRELIHLPGICKWFLLFPQFLLTSL